MAGSLEQISLDTPVPIEHAEREFHRQNEVMNYVHNTLGVPVSAQPGNAIVALPPDLTSMKDDQLGDLLNVYGQWAAFIDYKLACIDGERQSAEAYLSYIEARIRIEIKAQGGTGKKTVQDKNDIMETNPKVIEARNKSLFWEATYRLTKSVRDGVQLAWETVSRRITQRGQEVDRMRRETNVAGSVVTPARTFRRIGG